jgi:hypothetical protein
VTADTLKTQRRRRIREHEAYMQASQSNLPDNGDQETGPIWAQLAPFLDEALDQLAEADRTALVLRYFHNKPAREIAAVLCVGEAAAQKRLVRALEKLRAIFARRGLALSAAAVAAAIGANSVQAVPPGLVATITSAASAAVVANATIATAAANTALAMTTLQKAAVTAIAAIAIAAVIYEARQAAIARRAAQVLQEQQLPLQNQLEQARNQYSNATNRLAALERQTDQNNNVTSELLKLRGEVARLRAEKLPAQQSREATPKHTTSAKVIVPTPTPGNNWVVSNSGSDTYNLQLATLATGERNRYTGDARNLSYAVRAYARQHDCQMPSDFDQAGPVQMERRTAACRKLQRARHHGRLKRFRDHLHRIILCRHQHHRRTGGAPAAEGAMAHPVG